jgi:hypothetical protein
MTDCRYCTMIATEEGVVDSNDSAVAILERLPDGREQIVVVSRAHGATFFSIDAADRLAVLRLAYEAGLRSVGFDPRMAFKLEIPCTVPRSEEVAHAQVLVLTTPVEAAAEGDPAEEAESREMSMAERCLAIGVDYGRLSRIYSDEELERLLDL